MGKAGSGPPLRRQHLARAGSAFARAGRLYRVDLAFDGAGRLWVVVGVQVDNDWDLYARVRDGNEWSEPRRLTSALGSDLNHRLAAGAGRLYLTWQHFGEDGTADIYLSKLDVDMTPAPVRVSPSPANDWEPAVTVAPDDTVWVAWDSYDRGNYDIFARTFDRTDNGLTPAGDAREVATSPRCEVHT